MNSLPHGGIPFGWRDHLIALRWLGLLYRRPRQFRDDLSTFSPRQQLVMAFWLLVHSAPYVFVLSAVGSLLGRGLTGSEIRIEDSAFGIAFGIGLGIAFGIASGIAYGIGSGTALRIATGFGSGIFGGIFVSIFVWNTRGIAAGTAAGISFGIALVVSSTRIYYHLVHLPFVWPRSHGGWYARHPVAWDDLCSVPFPWLDRLLVEYAEKVPESGVAEIERLISSYPSQRMMALRARVRLVARQSAGAASLALLDDIIAALPEGKKGFLAETGKLRASAHAIATRQNLLNTVDRPVLRKPFAELLCKEIENFRHRIGGFYEPLRTEFSAAADQWLKIAEKQLRDASFASKY